MLLLCLCLHARRAFAGYWSVAATEETAMNGVWRRGPGVELFQALQKQLGEVPILAEDLGIITTDVVNLRRVLHRGPWGGWYWATVGWVHGTSSVGTEEMGQSGKRGRALRLAHS
jgi:hypothetical protein